MSVVNQLLSLSKYSLFTTGYDINSATIPAFGATLEFIPPIEAESPEPATVLLYVGAIAAVGARRAIRRWRSKSHL